MFSWLGTISDQIGQSISTTSDRDAYIESDKEMHMAWSFRYKMENTCKNVGECIDLQEVNIFKMENTCKNVGECIDLQEVNIFKMENTCKNVGECIDLQEVNIFKGRVSVTNIIRLELITSKTNGTFNFASLFTSKSLLDSANAK
ncbi:hypothetical protein E3N88_13679 [Mikania micrantha]|uniref:Uncharacterized protein n=1 Tax=Mikania micrantha TaxID=192012 RepID=A0A5N6NZA0_9ASTR|nr:hypothetical protein E3N88_13679 [Mikania micrantha]